MGKHNYVNLNRLPKSRRPDWKPWEALKKARDYAKGDRSCDHGNDFEGYCAHLAFCVYGMRTSGYYDAHAMWYNTPRAFRRYDRNPPGGAIACYVGGNHGHAAIVDVFGGIFTNDIHNGRYSAGAYSREGLLSPERAFGHNYVGWIFPYAISVEDGRKPPRTRHHGGGGHGGDKKPKKLDIVPGWFSVVPRAGLNARKRPSTHSNVVKSFKKGHAIFIEEAYQHEGRRWLKSRSGLYLAGGYLDRNESIKKDRKDARD